MTDKFQLTDSEISNLKEYLSLMTSLAKAEPPMFNDLDRDTTTSEEWESWNEKVQELNKRFSSDITKFLNSFISTTNEAGGVIDLIEALINSDVNQKRKRRIKTEVISDQLLENKFLPMLNGSLNRDISSMSSKYLDRDYFTKRATISLQDGRKITIEKFDKLQGGLSTSAKKIFDTAISYLTYNNYYSGNIEFVNPTVEIPFDKYAEACGYQVKPRSMDAPELQKAENERALERSKELKKNIRRDLHDISSILWTGEVTSKGSKENYREFRIFSSHGINNNTIRINFDQDVARYLVSSYVMQYPTALLKHDNRKPNAYAIGWKIAYHNSNDQNNAAGTDSTLSVKSMLSAAPEIPSYETLIARKQRNWKNKIKKPLEDSLDENIKIGLISRWQYRDAKTGKTFTNTEASSLSWLQFEALRIDFVMIDPPEQEERRAAKAAKKKKIAAEAEDGSKKKKRGRPPKKVTQK